MLQIDLSGKVAFITGVSSGIGLGIARQMAVAGATICGCSDEEEPVIFKQEMNALNAANMYIQCDVRKEAELQMAVQKSVDTFGRIDILISNAGKNVFTGAAATNNEDWQYNLDLNLTAHWKLAQLCKPYLEKNNGTIIIMASNHAYHTIAGCFPYNVAKTALTGLVRSLAIEWAPLIRTVGIAPGFIETPGNTKWFQSFTDAAQERQRTIDLHPVKRLGTTSEIGAWCVFLASEYAAFASGTTYLIDGGRSALMQDS